MVLYRHAQEANPVLTPNRKATNIDTILITFALSEGFTDSLRWSVSFAWYRVTLSVPPLFRLPPRPTADNFNSRHYQHFPYLQHDFVLSISWQKFIRVVFKALLYCQLR